MSDSRYNSGGNLTRTKKEVQLDSLEKALRAEFPDDLFVALKKLTLGQIHLVHRFIQDRIFIAHQEEVLQQNFTGKVLQRLRRVEKLSRAAEEQVDREAPKMEAAGFSVEDAFRYCQCFEEIAGDSLSERTALDIMKAISSKYPGYHKKKPKGETSPSFVPVVDTAPVSTRPVVAPCPDLTTEGIDPDAEALRAYENWCDRQQRGGW